MKEACGVSAEGRLLPKQSRRRVVLVSPSSSVCFFVGGVNQVARVLLSVVARSVGLSVFPADRLSSVARASTENLLVLPVSSSLRVPIFLFLPETNEASGWMGVRPSVPGITCEIINRPWWWIAGRGRGCSRTSCQHYGPRGVLPRSVLAHPPQTLALCTFWWR